MDLSFSGAGFMGCYYFGVVNCWNKYIPRERVRRVAGASAGSLIAAYYLMDLPLDACLKEIVGMMEDARSRALGVFDRSNQIVDTLPKVLDKLLPNDAHKRVSGRLFVVMTRLRDMKCVVVNQFDSKKDLIDALNCSCFIPVWSGNHVATYKGVKHIDGGFTNNLPVFDEHTIRICCFSGCSDIAPCDKSGMMTGNAMGMPFNINWKNLKRGGRALWPPPPSYIVDLLERGFHDTKSFILSNDLIQCDRCFNSTQLELQPIYSRITPTISPAASPSVSRSGSFMNLKDLQRSSSFRRMFGARNTPSPDKDKERESVASNRRKVHIKPHRQQQPAVSALFEQDRSKSGKQIKSKCLQRSQSEVGKQDECSGRVSFATKLREKLQHVASSKSSSSSSVRPMADSKTDLSAESREQMAPQSPMPTIVIEEPQLEDEGAQIEDRDERAMADEDAENDRQIVTILDIMKSQEEEEEEEEAEQEEDKLSPKAKREALKEAKKSKKKQHRTASMSSSETSSSSSDSAVGLDAPSPVGLNEGAPMPGTPAEKFFSSSVASRQHRAASLASDVPLDGAQLERLQKAFNNSSKGSSNNNLANSLLPSQDRFSFAPSPLPSCPPSPNLNRHCTECIRLRQQARMDGIDEALLSEVELYRSMNPKDAEREFNSFKFRLTKWFRQLSTPKYLYSFENYHKEDDGEQNERSAAANKKAAARGRRASLTTTTPPSQIPSFD